MRVCSNCGQFFSGVICDKCGKQVETPTVITISKPVVPTTEAPPARVPTEKERHAFERKQKEAERAKKRLEVLEERAEIRTRKQEERTAREERRLADQDTEPGPVMRLWTQFAHVMRLFMRGETRRSIHFVCTQKGSFAFVFLLPLCLLLPVCAGLAQYIVNPGQRVSPDVLVNFFSGFMPHFLKVLLLWAELSAVLVVLLRAQAFLLRTQLDIFSCISLVCTAQLPVLVLSPVAVLLAGLSQPLTVFVWLIAALLMIIMLFTGAEYAALECKRGFLAHFAVLLMVFLVTAAVIIDLNYPTLHLIEWFSDLTIT